MNRTENINLGGFPFTIDVDAFAHLEDYLDKIQAHFAGTEGFEEIQDDIEMRMAELLQSRLKSKAIVNGDDVQYAISVMGSPEDFGVDEAIEKAFHRKQGSNYKTGKRLFRDPEDKVIGGVCSGLASYFGVAEPLWIRIGFALVGIFGGIGLPLYLLMWALVPEAKTPKDFLAMRGEPINVNNIAKIVEEQVEQISDHLSEIGQDWKERRRKKKSWKKRRKY
ncbi:MAG: PspC domain-containing protein [Saprospiraceae bacterium]|nr:PspC domain-containing protein [Saprospiraceae bacterium]